MKSQNIPENQLLFPQISSQPTNTPYPIHYHHQLFLIFILTLTIIAAVRLVPTQLHKNISPTTACFKNTYNKTICTHCFHNSDDILKNRPIIINSPLKQSLLASIYSCINYTCSEMLQISNGQINDLRLEVSEQSNEFLQMLKARIEWIKQEVRLRQAKSWVIYTQSEWIQSIVLRYEPRQVRNIKNILQLMMIILSIYVLRIIRMHVQELYVVQGLYLIGNIVEQLIKQSDINRYMSGISITILIYYGLSNIKINKIILYTLLILQLFTIQYYLQICLLIKVVILSMPILTNLHHHQQHYTHLKTATLILFIYILHIYTQHHHQQSLIAIQRIIIWYIFIYFAIQKKIQFTYSTTNSKKINFDPQDHYS